MPSQGNFEIYDNTILEDGAEGIRYTGGLIQPVPYVSPESDAYVADVIGNAEDQTRQVS